MNSPINLYPLELSRVFVDKVWGSRELGWTVGTELKHLPTIGELWETSDGKEDSCHVLNGKHRLKPLREVVEELGVDLLGRRLADRLDHPFPLLIKYLFPSQPLSVQVHPDDDYAFAHENSCGKTEMWIVLHAEPESFIILGWRPGLDKDEILRMMKIGDFKPILNVIAPSSGDIYFISPGTVHALGPGVSILEIQQNSNLTYRLYDWDRLGSDGSPRELHLEKALQVLDFTYREDYRTDPVALHIDGNEHRYLCACRHFAVCEMDIVRPLELVSDPECVWVLNVISGAGGIQYSGSAGVRVEAGSTIAVPARMGNFVLEPEKQLTVIKSWVPDLRAEIIEPLRSEGIDDSRIGCLGGVRPDNDVRKLLS